MGNEQGKVSLHSFSVESREINCCFINSINSSQGSVSRLKAVPGFQCTLVLSVHQSEICSLTIASKLRRLATGDVAGVVSLSFRFDKSYLVSAWTVEYVVWYCNLDQELLAT